ncbi:MAG: hypothetical protein M1829_004529 [Trizodia sp. TS-e1964]|nr:MAG: hypothetical protein M1829_004529 [Trizodia sp. TS-e1964]
MTDRRSTVVEYPSVRGTLYFAEHQESERLVIPSSVQFRHPDRPRASSSPFRIAGRPPWPFYTKQPSIFCTLLLKSKNLASRENAKRFLRSVIYSNSAPTCGAATAKLARKREATPPPYSGRSNSISEPRRASEETTGSRAGGVLNTNDAASETSAATSPAEMVSRPCLMGSGSSSDGSATWRNNVHQKSLLEEKPIASSNGICISISLAEPVLYLQGFDAHDHDSRRTTMLRGSLLISVSKSVKLKAISLNFRGKARTEWPEGIPPRKVDFYEEQMMMNHTWTFFNALFPPPDNGHGADFARMAVNPTSSSTNLEVPTIGSSFDQFTRTSSPAPPILSLKEQRRLSLQANSSRSFERDNMMKTAAQKGYKTFHPGQYVYNFELPLDSHLPESIDVDLGNVRYELEVLVERAGAFRANLTGTKPVVVIRAPSEGALEQVEPIAISRSWEDQLHYDIVISGKSFPIGSQIPIAFKLTPLAKVQCHRIKIFISENVEYYCSNKRVHRLEPPRKVLLLEKRADSQSTSAYPGSTVRVISGGGIDYDSRQAAAEGSENVQRESNVNLLGDLAGEHSAGPTEFEFQVQLPNCAMMKEKERSQRLHFDTTYTNIKVHHWIKIVMRLSKADPDDSRKRRHFEISIDSPFHLLSCLAAQANVALPAYSGPENPCETRSVECGCPDSQRRTSSIASGLTHLSPTSTGSGSSNSIVSDQSSASMPNLSELLPQRPGQAHLGVASDNGQIRPIHLLRTPSFNPPAFDAEVAPPPLMTPPPQYDTVVGDHTRGLADYFARLANETSEEEEALERDGESSAAAASRGRMTVPLTPGGRVNRSMDEIRSWTPMGAAV